ncbi:AraC family transcriptional regulator [Aestuariicella hydrocarbonica]|uniref:AraC family transcriptional regulator n=1 Tax=Pseudomaricurvus hydrocarbonicus TaxID=1470433 RepID=A0A9E5MND8_9GAMM|nr:AraC family transcriptional regulator [Aestuariicella hydrocarbonica]NHO67430.1 AraC family transcriptional regulator [Aestuariicella hydrocarbonica]
MANTTNTDTFAPFFSLQKPLHTLPDFSQVRSANLAYFPQLVTSLGGDYQALLEQHGIAPRLIEDANSFIDCQSYVNLYEQCARELKDPLFGLHLAQHQQADTYGTVVALCRAASTVREALTCLIDFIPVVHSSESVLELVPGSLTSELRWMARSGFSSNTQANYQGLLLNLKTLREIGDTSFQPEYVCIPGSLPPELVEEFEAIIECPLRVGTGISCIGFPTNWLDQPVLSANSPLYQLLYGYLFRLKGLPRQTILERVNVFVARGLSTADLSMESCAKHLGMSPRSLQLRLQAVGKSYSEVVEYHRLERAKCILRNDTCPVAAVADQLGYSERTSFGRAFKRWTGMSPQQYRRAQQ